MNREKDSSFIDFFIESIYLAIIFLVPIYFGLFFITNNPFELHKMVLFRFFLFILVFLSLVKFINLPKFKSVFALLLKKYFYVPLIVILFSLLSVCWSINPIVSFFGTDVRQMGWLNEFYLFLFFIILVLSLVFSKNKEQKIKRLIITAIISSAVVSFYAVLQFVGIDFLIWDEPVLLTKRAVSTLGQPNFLGSFLLLAIPLSAYFLSKSKTILSRSLFVVVLFFQIFALISSGSRGAWLSLFLAIALFLFLFYFNYNKRIFYSGLFLLFFLFLILTFGKNPVSTRFQSAFVFSEGSSSVRVSLWESSVKAILKRDWGYGLENQKEAIIDYYQKDWAIFSKVNVVFDRAHNVFLDIFLTLGLLGFLAYFYFYFFFFRLIFKNIKEDRKEELTKWIFLALTAYLISLFFNFAVVVTSIYFWFLLAVIVAINFSQLEEEAEEEEKENKRKLEEEKEKKEKEKLLKMEGDKDVKEENKKEELIIEEDYSSGRFLKFIIIVLVLAGCLFAINLEIKTLKVDYYFLKAKESFYRDEIPSSLLLFSYIREEGSFYKSYNYTFIGMIFDGFTKFKDEASRFLSIKETEEILKELDEEKKNCSFEYRLARAQALAILGKFDEAEEIFDSLEERFSNYPNFYFKKAKMGLLKKDYNLAIENYNKTLGLLPENLEVSSQINLKSLQNFKHLIYKDIADIYFEEKKYELALDNYFLAYNNNLNNFSVLEKIIESYYLQGDYARASFYSNQGIKRRANYYVWYFLLGKINYELKDEEAAYLNFKIAERLSPDNLEVKNFLERIKK
ncbi:MAG: O-antigen ligase family protein [Patescibacteria group bacterium]|jgi:putative inorganic carbon (HCO3(-)) transporter